MKIFQIEYLRAIASILVVAFHAQSTLALPKYFGDQAFEFLSGGFSGVQIFFVISGFVIFYAHRNDNSGLDSVNIFARKRFVRIYIPLWIVLCLLLPIFITNIFNSNVDTYDYIASFLILPNPDSGLLAVEWTLQHEVLFYLLFVFYIINRKIGLFVLLLWAIGGCALTIFVSGSWLFDFFFNSNHLLFIFGMAIAWWHVNRRYAFPHTVLACGVAVFSITWMLAVQDSANDDIIILGFGSGTAMSIYGLIGANILSRNYSFFRLLGSSSYSLYLIHFPLISFLCKIYMATGAKNTGIPQILYLILTIILCIASSIVFYIYLEKPVMKLISRRLLPVRTY